MHVDTEVRLADGDHVVAGLNGGGTNALVEHLQCGGLALFNGSAGAEDQVNEVGQAGAGEAAHQPDSAYEKAGAALGDGFSGRVVAKVATGEAPRSMDIAPDGRSLYIVNYESNTVSKVRTRDMAVLQTVATNAHPIGITYDRATRQVWVACYTGSLMVFRDV